MKLLLDTHVFLWWRGDSRELGKAARDAMMHAGNEVYVSAVAAWEIVIKRALGKLRFDESVGEAIAEEGFTPLEVSVRHVDELSKLADHHRDPFDRLLVAQARVEGMSLVSADPWVLRYEDTSLLPAGRSSPRTRPRRGPR